MEATQYLFTLGYEYLDSDPTMKEFQARVPVRDYYYDQRNGRWRKGGNTGWHGIWSLVSAWKTALTQRVWNVTVWCKQPGAREHQLIPLRFQVKIVRTPVSQRFVENRVNLQEWIVIEPHGPSLC